MLLMTRLKVAAVVVAAGACCIGAAVTARAAGEAK
ncbi:hypothetical protein LCGC14_2162320, partial [marine sediment metagenome]